MAIPRVTIIGAGLGGALLGIYLARRGWEVQLFDQRDLRREPAESGRSIKLTLAQRGLSALAELGLAEHVKRNICVPLWGRAVHTGTGTVTYQPYGKDDDEVIHSFSRCDLNRFLLDTAEAEPTLSLHLDKRCVEIEKETAAAVVRDSRTGETTRVEADILIGADGAYSAVRRMMMVRERIDYHQDFLPWGYKELTIEATAEDLPPMDRHALHLWPCGDHMLFGLPNIDGSLCGVCTLPMEGPNSFESLTKADDVERLFRIYFADVIPFMPNFQEEFRSRPISEFVTIRTSRWYHKGKVLLVGDAAHAVVPFYGQGMNAAFEDCAVLNRLIEQRGTGDWQALFAEFQALRKPNTDVLAELSVENFHELRDTVRRPIVTARKHTSIFLNKLFRQHAVPLYTMISHSNMPYAEAVERHRRQERIARCLGLDLVVGAVSLNVRLRTALARRRAARLAREAAAEGRQGTVVQTVAVSLPGDSEERKTLRSERKVVSPKA
ncbi:MAG TPA: NAD(P)/FAD-dependent oxidoreductase [Thermoanaerobaculia bacterium]|nr:NAD(P)/FAD-dependent oxidoreductase [Thermoanaerobaculia bacterium]